MYLTLIVALIFLVAGGINVYGGSWDEAAACFAASAALLPVFFKARADHKKSLGFLAWLLENRETLTRGPALYNGSPVSLDTRVTRFDMVVSALVLTTRVPSRYLVQGIDNMAGSGVLYSLASLLLGWWGVPWGPVYTVQALVKNIRGGQKQTIGEITAALNAGAAPPKTQ